MTYWQLVAYVGFIITVDASTFKCLRSNKQISHCVFRFDYICWIISTYCRHGLTMACLCDSDMLGLFIAYY